MVSVKLVSFAGVGHAVPASVKDGRATRLQRKKTGHVSARHGKRASGHTLRLWLQGAEGACKAEAENFGEQSTGDGYA